MSKLIQHLETHQTNRRFGAPSKPLAYSDLLSIRSESFELAPCLIEHRITVTLGAIIRHDTMSAEPLPVRHVARMIEQEVFGEFREDFHKIHRALWQCDIEEAKKLLHAMEDRMFSS